MVNVHLSVINSVSEDDSLQLLELSDRAFQEKFSLICDLPFYRTSNSSQKNNPDCKIVFEDLGAGAALSSYARSLTGLRTGDNARFKLFFWEPSSISDNYAPSISSELNTESHFSGRTEILRWQRGMGDLADFAEIGIASLQGGEAWGKKGIIVNLMSSLPASLYTGEFYDMNCGVVWPTDDAHLAAIWCFLSSPDYFSAIRKIDKQLKLTTATLLKVPFDLNHWSNIANDSYPYGLPKPHSNDPAQWLFDGHPRGSADPNGDAKLATNSKVVTPHGVRSGMAEHPLQVAVARLLGYRWPRRTGSSFMDCPAIAELDEIEQSGLVDTDGIVALPALAGEPDAASRLRELIRAVWGPDYDENTVRALLAAEDAKANDLAIWLADEFFEGHCRLFHQTPFLWQIWDGLRGGFSALVNYHKLCAPDGAGRRLLEKLRDTHLGDWIAAQKRAQLAGEPGAENRLIAAEHLRGELTKVIQGEPPYDIFVRWKPLFRQPIGWEPDIDDGVRLNIRPFFNAKPKHPRGKDACILRVTPRVKKHAGADRGAEPHHDKKDYPWFWADDSDVEIVDFTGRSEFQGRRYSDFHYTRALKEGARATKAAKP